MNDIKDGYGRIQMEAGQKCEKCRTADASIAFRDRDVNGRKFFCQACLGRDRKPGKKICPECGQEIR